MCWVKLFHLDLQTTNPVFLNTAFCSPHKKKNTQKAFHPYHHRQLANWTPLKKKNTYTHTHTHTHAHDGRLKLDRRTGCHKQREKCPGINCSTYQLFMTVFLFSKSTFHHFHQCASLWRSQSLGLLSSCTSWPRHHRWFRSEWWHHRTWWWTSEMKQTKTETMRFRNMVKCVCVSLSCSLSLSHTHMHTHICTNTGTSQPWPVCHENVFCTD